jgi:hypothetical protein
MDFEGRLIRNTKRSPDIGVADMEWLASAFWARIGWMAGEIAMAAAVVLIVVMVVTLASLPRLWRQSRCKHAHYFETGKCDAVCSDCGKNLGFIGSWRSKLTIS